MVLKIKKHKAIILLGKVMMPWLFLLLAVQVTLSDGRSSINDEELPELQAGEKATAS